MERIFKAAVDRGASDLHIKAGDVFRARINGELVALTKQPLTPEQTRDITLHLVTNDYDKARLDNMLDYDCSWSASGIGRFRVNIMRQRGSFSVVMRVIPWEIPTLEKLGLPLALSKIASVEQGMILVTGVAGSGKSSTMAALINDINQRENRHILTLENPIEFLHSDINSSVTQREIGSDTADFKTGLRAALRQDPDVIVIDDEMRHAGSVDMAITAAETGHLLMSTLQTPDAQSTILRIMKLFPLDEQDVIRMRLADSLYAIISLPTRGGATEVMVNTPEIKDLIRDGTRLGEIRDLIDFDLNMRMFSLC
jgi:twitching motility protein PilT